MERLYINLESDRLAVASVLIKNKYTVRSSTEKRPGTKSYVYFLEYERNPETEKAKKGDGADED